MDANDRPTLPAIQALLAAPQDGRLLAFGAATSDFAMDIAAARPDLLIILCDTTSEVTRAVSDRCVAEKIDNLVVGDTHAGPPVDRALAISSTEAMTPSEFLALRTAMLPGGYAIFIEPGTDAEPTIAKLKGFGFAVADQLESPIGGHYVIRAR